jgi:hypothetical protein
MSKFAQNSKTTDALVAALRLRAASLPAEATEAATLLSKYSLEIDHPSSENDALKNFNAIVMHHKGLRDLIVPGVRESEWVSFVNEARTLSKAAMRARGLDKTILGRLHALFNKSNKEQFS